MFVSVVLQHIKSPPKLMLVFKVTFYLILIPGMGKHVRQGSVRMAHIYSTLYWLISLTYLQSQTGQVAIGLGQCPDSLSGSCLGLWERLGIMYLFIQQGSLSFFTWQLGSNSSSNENTFYIILLISYLLLVC